MLGKIEGRRKRGAIEDEMFGWHHQLNGHECEQTPGVVVIIVYYLSSPIKIC